MKSLRVRLITWVALSAAVLTLATGVVLYLFARAYLIKQFDDALVRKARILASTIELEEDRLNVFEDLDMSDYESADDGGFVQVSLDANVLYTSESLNGAALEIDLFDAEALADEDDDAGEDEDEDKEGEDDDDGDRDDDEDDAEDGDALVYAMRWIELPGGMDGRGIVARVYPVVDEDPDPIDPDEQADEDEESIAWPGQAGGEPVTLVLARNSDEITRALASLRLGLALIGLMVSGLMSCVIYLVVSRGLRPIGVLASEVGALNEKTLDHQIDLPQLPSELKPIVAQFNGLLDRLNIAFDRQRRFSADVAHETRTPLAGLRSTIEVALSRDRTPAQYADTLTQLLDVTVQMQSMIEALLQLASLDSAAGPRDAKPMDVNTAVEHAIDAGKRNLGKPPDCKIEKTLSASKPILGDPGLLSLALNNVLHNALNYVNPGGKIGVRTRDTSDGVEVLVENTGCQVDGADESKVFDRFWRADTSRTETGTHFGLGLSLTQLAIKAVGGVVSAKCERGKHFAITIELPGGKG